MAKQPTAKPDGADDLAILHPERRATIASVAVTMREYGHVEGMRLHALITPIVDGIKAVALSGELADTDALRPVFGDNADAVVQLTAVACDQSVEWVAGLSDEDGNNLQLLWWAVNSHFFGRRVRESLIVHQLKASAGLMSTQPSHAPATTPSGSAATRRVN